MSDQDLRVSGLAELKDALDTLPVKLERNIMRGALRAGLKPIQAAAQSGIHNITGLLAAGLKLSTRASGGTVSARLTTKGEHGLIAHLVEFGTRPHLIEAGVVGALVLPDGRVVVSVNHPGAAAKPFMRPAFDSQAEAAIQGTGDYIGKRLTKEGLDAPEIKVEGDL